MLTPKNQYSYFESLEKTIKVGLSAYLLVFCAGAMLILVGWDKLHVVFTSEDSKTVVPVLVVLSAAIFYGFFLIVSTINWLGEIHIWLDEKFFGFLKKSNEIIYRQLITALEPGERVSARAIEPARRGAMAKTIFSRLANDNLLFQRILESGIFRDWIWYWITIYGTFVFTVLSVVGCAAYAVAMDHATKTMFAIPWSLAFVHLAAAIFLGNYLIRRTRHTIDTIVRSHKDEIAAYLRSSIELIPTPS